MAAVGSVRLPVHLSVGDTTAEVGAVVFRLTTEGVPASDIRAEVAALLRGVADEIEASGVDG